MRSSPPFTTKENPVLPTSNDSMWRPPCQVKIPFISETKGTQLIYVSTEEQPRISMTILKGKKEEEVTEEIDLASFIDIKGWKSQGNRLSPHTIKEIAGLVAEEEPETEDDNVGIGGTIEWDLEKGDKKVKGGKGQGELF